MGVGRLVGLVVGLHGWRRGTFPPQRMGGGRHVLYGDAGSWHVSAAILIQRTGMPLSLSLNICMYVFFLDYQHSSAA